eukprot:CAMPEP_0175688214 /NCGR_PEP_ID=MMETSP0097-20121207/28767_1 /TAXON_ID=311494 /ORGANISM="Alexandrium monilatum, Strain CCMP3105" /LENGTH=167 /DNA_ID=CAMNT_0016995227 /DNA_START=874 /DNA_END=1374 /DNA_ORIENTATION=+
MSPLQGLDLVLKVHSQGCNHAARSGLGLHLAEAHVLVASEVVHAKLQKTLSSTLLKPGGGGPKDLASAVVTAKIGCAPNEPQCTVQVLASRGSGRDMLSAGAAAAGSRADITPEQPGREVTFPGLAGGIRFEQPKCMLSAHPPISGVRECLGEADRGWQAATLAPPS